MCGIVGIVSREPGAWIDEARLRRMRDVLTHRGPDDEGLWVEGPVGFGHRRLAIVDLASGQQPMTNEDGRLRIVYNGEIYNHADLRPGLEARGHRYHSRSDTETILHLYEEDAERAVEHLHGMFALALWDRQRRQLLLARDRLGIKPLYYTWTDTELLFASEIKAILAAGTVRPVLNDEVVPELLATRFVAGDETLFRGIRRLRPGHTLLWSAAQGERHRQYWQVPAPSITPPRSRAVEAADLRERLTGAVRRHLMSDVPLGLFLSGGLDSSALAAVAARLVDGPLQTFAVGFAEAEANELSYARLVAARIGAEHREVVVSAPEYFNALPKLVWQEDEPIAFTSSVPLYFVSKLARDHVKVVLTGEGADELFLGYNRYRVTLWNERLGRPYRILLPAPARRAVARAITALPHAVRRWPERTFLALGEGVRALFLDNFAVFPDRLRHRLLARPEQLVTRDPYARALDCYARAEGGPLERMSQTDLQTYLHELLMKQDQMSMAASIESRVPFLDDELVEHVSSMRGQLRLRGLETKAVLRAAVRDLVPSEILTRPKMGFPVPIGRWLRGRFWPVVEEFVLGARASRRGVFDQPALRRLALEHRSGASEHGDRLWLLINFEIWQRIFLEGEAPADVMGAVKWRAGFSYANPVGEGGRPVAAQHRGTAAQLPYAVGTVAPAPGHTGHDQRTG
jgi:asparagine synthase (glutamine-hydrolysing)